MGEMTTSDAAMDDHRWLVEHPEVLEPYTGEWVIVLDRAVYGHDRDLNRLVDRFDRDHPDRVPFIMLVPDRPWILGAA